MGKNIIRQLDSGNHGVVFQIGDAAVKLFPNWDEDSLIVQMEIASNKQVMEILGTPIYKRYTLLHKDSKNVIKEIYGETLPVPGIRYILCNGKNLDDKLHENNYLADTVFEKVLECLSAVLPRIWNRGYTHCDIKPDNIMLCSEDASAKLIDFGSMTNPETKINDGRCTFVTEEYRVEYSEQGKKNIFEKYIKDVELQKRVEQHIDAFVARKSELARRDHDVYAAMLTLFKIIGKSKPIRNLRKIHMLDSFVTKYASFRPSFE